MPQKIMKRAIQNSRPDRKNYCGSNHSYNRSVYFVFAGLVLLLLNGCTLLNDGVSENDSFSGYTTQREEDSAMIEDSGLAEISRPPIDLELPDGLKTATLAMG